MYCLPAPYTSVRYLSFKYILVSSSFLTILQGGFTRKLTNDEVLARRQLFLLSGRQLPQLLFSRKTPPTSTGTPFGTTTRSVHSHLLPLPLPLSSPQETHQVSHPLLPSLLPYLPVTRRPQRDIGVNEVIQDGLSPHETLSPLREYLRTDIVGGGVPDREGLQYEPDSVPGRCLSPGK